MRSLGGSQSICALRLLTVICKMRKSGKIISCFVIILDLCTPQALFVFLLSHAMPACQACIASWFLCTFNYVVVLNKDLIIGCGSKSLLLFFWNTDASQERSILHWDQPVSQKTLLEIHERGRWQCLQKDAGHGQRRILALTSLYWQAGRHTVPVYLPDFLFLSFFFFAYSHCLIIPGQWKCGGFLENWQNRLIRKKPCYCLCSRSSVVTGKFTIWVLLVNLILTIYFTHCNNGFCLFEEVA